MADFNLNVTITDALPITATLTSSGPAGAAGAPGLMAAATNAELLAETVDTKSLTPLGWAFVRSAIIPKVATSNTGAQNVAAINAAFDEAIGTSNPVTNTRTANRGIEFRSGIYKLATPIVVRSVIGLNLVGKGYVEFSADANMAAVFDINGAAYSTFAGFTITGVGSVQVDDAFYTYFDSTGSQRTNTANHYEDITIRNLDFITGVRVGKVGIGAVQVDDDTYTHIMVNGLWVSEAANPGRWQEAFHIGTGTVGNNLTHMMYHPRVQNCRYGINNDNTQVVVFGAGLAGGETGILTGTTGFAHYQGIRCETYLRLMTTTNTTANPNISLKNVVYNASGIHSDGQWLKFSQAGVMTAENITVQNVPTGIPPLIRVDAANTSRLEIKALSVQGTDAPFELNNLFSIAGSGNVRARACPKMNASAQSIGMQDWSSETAALTTVYDTAGVKTHWTTRPLTLIGASIWAISGGNSGASGRRGAAGTVRGGGGSGGPGGIAEAYFSAAELPSGSFSFTVPTAAAGGAAVTANDTNGNPGALAGALTVGPLIVGQGAAAGGGTTVGGTAGTGALNMSTGAAGSAGAAGGVGSAPPGTASSTNNGGAGGGSGAGVSAAEAVTAGGTGGASAQRTGYVHSIPAAGVAGTINGGTGGNGNNPTTNTERTGGTGGGGGGSDPTAAGGAGGNGGRGAGGGGGAASTNGANSGKGGDGGLGCVIITEYHNR